MGNSYFPSFFTAFMHTICIDKKGGEKQMTKIEKINLNGTIAESIEMVRMLFCDNFTKRHLDMLLAIISMADKNNKDLAFEVPVQEFAKIYNPSNPWGSQTKSKIHKIVEDMMDLKFGIHNKNLHKTFWYHWVKSVGEPDDINETITIVLSDDVKKFFIQLHDKYFIYTLKNILALRTLTEACIYHWAYAKKGFNNDIPISIDDAKLYFCGRTDISNAEFIRTHLKPALKRINEKTDLHIEYEKVCADKTDRRIITSLKFKIECNYEKKPAKKRSESQVKYDKERGKAMYKELQETKEELQEAKEEIQFLSKRNFELETKEIIREQQLDLEVNKSSLIMF